MVSTSKWVFATVTAVLGHHCILGSFVSTTRRHHHGSFTLRSASSSDDSLLQELKAMRVSALQDELKSRQVPTTGIFEKDELVQLLLRERRKNPITDSTNHDKGQTSISPPQCIQLPLNLVGHTSATSLPTSDNGERITVEAGGQQFLSLKCLVKQESARVGVGSFTLNLLLDTACSGLVLDQALIDKHNLPKLSTPVTVTGAGGQQNTPSLTQLDTIYFGDDEDTGFGPLPAASQDVGMLPDAVDGIMGLSFLSQFACVEFDFMGKTLSLYKERPPGPRLADSLVAEADLELVPMYGLYAMNVFLGERGPVKLILDTGADTVLNWKGVQDLGLGGKSSSFLERVPDVGGIGSDGVAMQFTHRLFASSSLQLGKKSTSLPGLSLKDSKRMEISVGDIAILDLMKNSGVGGLLGMDALRRCSCVRMYFSGGRKYLQLYSE